MADIPDNPPRVECVVMGGDNDGARVIVARDQLTPILTMIPAGEGFYSCVEVPAVFREFCGQWWHLNAQGVPVVKMNPATIYRVVQRVDGPPSNMAD